MTYLFFATIFLSLNSYPQNKTKLFCEFFRYSNCPSLCEKECSASHCTKALCTSDCDGPKSCTYKGTTEKTFDINHKDQLGRTALMGFFKTTTSEAQLNEILDLGADINARDNDGRTPLMYALSSQANLKIIELLIAKGADAKTTDNYGETALTLANLSPSNLSVIKYLIAKGVDPRAKNKGGQSVVSRSQCGDELIFKFWSSLGIDLNEMIQGRSAISNCMALLYPQGLKGIKYLVAQGVPLPENWEKFPESRYVKEIRKTLSRKKIKK